MTSRNDPCPCGSGRKYKKCCMLSGGGAVATNTADPQDLLRSATGLHQAGNLSQAIVEYRQLIAQAPTMASAHYYLGQALGQAGHRDEGIESLQRATELDPHNGLYFANLSALLLKVRRADEALAAAERAANVDPGEVAAHATLAACYERLNRLDEAAASLETSLQLAPDDADSVLGLCSLYRRLRRFDEARQYLEPFVRKSYEPEYMQHGWKELGLVLEAQGVYDNAFRAFERAGEQTGLTRAARDVDRERTPHRIARFRACVTPELLARWTGLDHEDNLPTPAFLVGFPRSGTTMTEQVLAAHRDIVTSDESPILLGTERTLAELIPDAPDTPGRMQLLTPDHVRRLRARYWELAREVVPDAPVDRSVLLVDKNPLTINALGLINVLFPESRVIVALRDPRDVCLSCFTQVFRLNTAMIHFLSLNGAAALYDQVMDLWLHQRSMLTLRTLEVRYEDTVTDLPREAARLLEFLGVAWDESVLSFHEKARERFISTPSYAAVTEPVHSRAKGKWRRYESQFAPVMHHLERYLDAFGYER